MAKFVINEQFLQQVETLQILIKNNIAGLFGGNHQTRNFGSSCEFADHRDYMAGDDNNPGAAWYPEPIRMWKEDSRIVSNGNYVMLVVSGDCDSIVQDFNALF